MADEQDKWLNRETAERLLNGESLEAVDASARDQAERLAQVLGALSGQAAPATGELPGEQAALAAFRKAREAAEAERTTAALAEDARGRRSGAAAPPADAGLIRIGAPARTGTPGGRPRRPRWARPARLALAAALTVGTLGGAAMAVGGGVLHTFRPDRPDPAASVSADRTSGTPLASASPSAPSAPGPGVPSGSPGAPSGDASGTAVGPGGSPAGSGSPSAGSSSGAPGASWQDIARACRDLRDGKAPDSGRMRALANLAGGSSHVSRYCKVILPDPGSAAGGTGDDQGNGSGSGSGKGAGNGQGGDDDGRPGRSGHGGDGGNGGNGAGSGKGHSHHP
ncbi:hypothetical protein [Streptomyces camelliae]|uniref:Extensin n=1 Tax=Streptomyces camelliae TaxID=3004093 RepID=A0ABY7P169_9ACTN|nr:hypothetical protein [Streptomyces sp. HUAS 2-6]WBO64253.1 hypothetical protein O1G22_16160 [Streptomyces sp. HUAS 2-6]